MSDTRKIFSLAQVVSSIKKTIEERYQQTYWVKAEMHKLNVYPSGHAFPELVHKENDRIVAQMGGAIWKHNLERINKLFVEVVKEPLTEGSTLLMQVKISFNETFGLSLQILDIDPNFTLGELQREREETLKRLQQEGVLNANQFLSFPLLPKRIAIISADTSKGLSDFMKVLTTNPWGYVFYTQLFPAYLQGDQASDSIQKQLQRIRKVKAHFDVVVIVRGGGGEVGLSCYNNYALCRAIVDFPLPVLTGIGHSTNLTVAEMIAYRNAITPTELADFFIQAFHNFSVPIKEARKLLRTYTENLLKIEKERFETSVNRIKQSSELYLERKKSSIIRTAELMRIGVNQVISRKRTQLESCRSEFKSDLLRSCDKQKEHLTRFREKLTLSTAVILERQGRQIEHLANMCHLLDPQRILQRGYAIARINNKVIDANNVPEQAGIISIETSELIVLAEHLSTNKKEKS
jgi:exodeoxyribonuclease VII large subunit